MPRLDHVSSDPRWPAAHDLLATAPAPHRRRLGLLGAHTFATSLTPRSSSPTPPAVRAALARFSTYALSAGIDLSQHVTIVDEGDIEAPDTDQGRQRISEQLHHRPDDEELLLILGGDNAITWTALQSLAGDHLADWGLITLDAHLDVRDGVSNGSPVRQLTEAGLPGRHVVQVGLQDFSNAASYVDAAVAAGHTLIPRAVLRTQPLEAVLRSALAIAGADGRRVYVDIDVDVVDRSSAPGCPAATPGGLSADELRQAVRMLASDPRVRAMDFTEVDITRDAADERTVRLVAACLLEAATGVVERKS